jgi:hypothetical protein
MTSTVRTVGLAATGAENKPAINGTTVLSTKRIERRPNTRSNLITLSCMPVLLACCLVEPIRALFLFFSPDKAPRGAVQIDPLAPALPIADIVKQVRAGIVAAYSQHETAIGRGDRFGMHSTHPRVSEDGTGTVTEMGRERRPRFGGDCECRVGADARQGVIECSGAAAAVGDAVVERGRAPLVELAAHPFESSLGEVRQRRIAMLVAFQHPKSHQAKQHGTGHFIRRA